MTETAPAWLATPEAARLLGLADQTLIQWRHEKKGPPFARLGKSVRYFRPDLEQWALRARAGGFGGGVPTPVPVPAPDIPAPVLVVRRDPDWWGGAVIQVGTGPQAEADAIGLGDLLESLGVPEELIRQVESIAEREG